MEGARWDIMQGVIMESKLKELFPQMPVINVRVSIPFIIRLYLISNILVLVDPYWGPVIKDGCRGHDPIRGISPYRLR